MLKLNMANDNDGLFDGVIPDITGDGKADLADAIIYNATLLADDDKAVKNKKYNNKSDKLALIISTALTAAGILAIIFILTFIK